MASFKTKLSAAVITLIAAGATAPVILDQFLNEKEGDRPNSYQDGAGVWTICRGVTHIAGKAVTPGMKLTNAECQQANELESRKALAWVDAHVHVPLTEPQRAGIASFCPYNIGPSRCFTSTFYKKLNAGDRRGACQEIKRWVRDGGRDCRERANGCYGQVIRRDQEAALACWGLDN